MFKKLKKKTSGMGPKVESNQAAEDPNNPKPQQQQQHPARSNIFLA
jgi:hypothetical protein